MITTEERLRAAMRAAADTVAPGAVPPLRLPDEPGRQRGRARGDRRVRGWLRAMIPLAAAAAVAGVVIASLLLTGGVHTPPGGGEGPASGTSALGGLPLYYLALSGPPGFPQGAVVRATATGKVLATVTAPRPYRGFTFVTGTADDRTFVLAAQRWWHIAPGTPGLAAEQRDGTTPVTFFRARFDPSTGTIRLTALSFPRGLASGSLAGIAVSPDGSKLAMALHTAEIEVVTLATGSARHWGWPGSVHSTGSWVGNIKPDGEPLSWTADGRILAFQFWTESGGITQVRLLDTTAPGSSLRAARPAVVFAGHGKIKTGPTGNSIITPDGTKIVTVASRARGARSQVAEFPARTSQPAGFRSLGNAGTPWNVLWTDSSGRTVIVSALPTVTATESVIGVLHGEVFTPLPGAPLNTNNIAW